MTKKEFMAISLPHLLKCVFDYGADEQLIELLTGITCNGEQPQGFDYDGDIDGCLPILRPLSDLTKEIEHGGEKFVSWMNLANNGWSSPDIMFYPNTTINPDTLPFFIIHKLIEWHFDIADLIEKGEAIDVNTLETNPYK